MGDGKMENPFEGMFDSNLELDVDDEEYNDEKKNGIIPFSLVK